MFQYLYFIIFYLKQVIEAHLQKAPSTQKVSFFYLIDSIMKNVDKPHDDENSLRSERNFKEIFSKNIILLFCTTFKALDKSSRMSMFQLRKTWNKLLAQEILYGIDVGVNRMDPAWPITAKLLPITTRSLPITGGSKPITVKSLLINIPVTQMATVHSNSGRQRSPLKGNRTKKMRLCIDESPQEPDEEPCVTIPFSIPNIPFNPINPQLHPSCSTSLKSEIISPGASGLMEMSADKRHRRDFPLVRHRLDGSQPNNHKTHHQLTPSICPAFPPQFIYKLGQVIEGSSETEAARVGQYRMVMFSPSRKSQFHVNTSNVSTIAEEKEEEDVPCDLLGEDTLSSDECEPIIESNETHLLDELIWTDTEKEEEQENEDQWE